LFIQGVDSGADWFAEPTVGGVALHSERVAIITDRIQRDALAINSSRASAVDHIPILDPRDVITFSYSGTYIDTVTRELVGVEDHSGTSRHFADYSPLDTCSGVAAGAAKLDRLIERLVELNPEMRIDVVAHSMGGLVAAYLLATSNAGYLDHIATVTTLDSPLQGTDQVDAAGTIDLFVDVSVCLRSPRSTQAHVDMVPESAVLTVIAGLEGSARAATIYSIKSELEFGTVSVGSPLPNEPVWVVKCGGDLPHVAHSCVWEFDPVVAAISRLINLDLPSVSRLYWADDGGRVVRVIERDEVVTLVGVFGDIQDGVVVVTVYEVDPNSGDDFVLSGDMTVVNGVGSVKWVARWESDFLGFGGDPEYKFVIGDVSSGELVVR
jgi:hypothetical protein